MKIASLTIENFRGYKEPTTISFNDFTAIIGKNDVGKSTLLEALDLFFEGGVVKLDKGDPSVSNNDNNVVRITVSFRGFADSIVLDSSVPTSLSGEHLIDSNGNLTICKEFKPGSTTRTVYIKARHPFNDKNDPIIALKNADLKRLAKEKGVDQDANNTINSELRQAIYTKCTIPSEDNYIKISGTDELKSIYENIESEFPVFALFQSDRKSQDSDSEIADPFKAIIKQVLEDAKAELDEVGRKVREKLETITSRTEELMVEANPDFRGEKMLPRLPEKLGWEKAFSTSIDNEIGIPLNKRGSGFRRLVLLNFFRAEAEKKGDQGKTVIYAIEEPETSQHPDWQKVLIEALDRIAYNNLNRQVIITTHSPHLAKLVKVDDLRFVEKDSDDRPEVLTGDSDTDSFIQKIVNSLGVFADIEYNGVKLFFIVEGHTDIDFFKHMLKLFGHNIESDNRICFIPAGGSNLIHHINYNHIALGRLDIPQLHIYDADVNKYIEVVAEVNRRGNGDKGYILANGLSIENYYNPKVIKEKLELLEGDTWLDFMSDDWKENWLNTNMVKKGNPPIPGLLDSLTPTFSHLVNNYKKVFITNFLPHLTQAHFEELGVWDEMKDWYAHIESIINS